MALSPNSYTGNPLLHVRKQGLESALIESRTLGYGLKTLRTSESLFIATDRRGSALGFKRAASNKTSVVADEICTDKSAAKILFQLNGIPTAYGETMPRRGFNSANKFVARNGWPVVVKPLRGSGGRAVIANIRDKKELQDAIANADSAGGFLIEKHVTGIDYRFSVIGDSVKGVWIRDPANVVGDGSSTIDSLIDQKNVTRSQNPHLTVRPIKKDQAVRAHLARHNMDLNTMPANGEKVYLRSAANLSAGGDNIELLPEVHPTLLEIASRAASLVPNLELAGVDMLLEDHTKPASEQSVNVCEINGRPGISAHEFPLFGPAQDISKSYVRHLAESNSIDLTQYAEGGTFRYSLHGRFNEKKFVGLLEDYANQLDAELELLPAEDGSNLALVCHCSTLTASVLANFIVRPHGSAIANVEACQVRLVR